MRRFIRTIFILLSVAAITQACENNNPENYQSKFATLVVNNPNESQEYPYYFVTDDSTKVLPANYKQINYNPKTNDRVIVYYQLPTLKSDEPVTADIKGVEDVLTKDIKKSDKPNEFGRDRTEPMAIWYSGGIYGATRSVNIKFKFWNSKAYITHIVNLVEDTNVKDPIEDGYYRLQFHHDARGDYRQFVSYGYVSFPLTEAYIKEGIKGLKIRFDSFDSSKEEYIKIDY